MPVLLPGKMIVLADQGSRLEPLATEWMLVPDFFDSICQRISPFSQVDLLSSRVSARLPRLPTNQPLSLFVGRESIQVCGRDSSSFHLPSSSSVDSLSGARASSSSSSGFLQKDPVQKPAGPSRVSPVLYFP